MGKVEEIDEVIIMAVISKIKWYGSGMGVVWVVGGGYTDFVL